MMFTRRTMLAAAPAFAGMTGLIGTAQAQPAPTPAPAPAAPNPQAPGFYRYKVGDIEVTAINEGFVNRPLEGFVRNAELADVKKAMGEAFLPDTALPIPFTTSVVRAGGKTVLIDTGFGDSGPPTSGRWMANFRAAGFDPAKVDAIIFSHFHADHISGLRLKDGSVQFPNAEIMVPEAEWAYWMNESNASSAPDAAKPNFPNIKRVFAPIADKVARYAPGKELVPGITAIATPGHTPGHVSHLLSSGSKSMMLMADVANHPALFVRNPAWSAIFDHIPDMARETRIKALDMAATERTLVAFYHAPFPGAGYIAKDGATYRFIPVQWTTSI